MGRAMRIGSVFQQVEGVVVAAALAATLLGGSGCLTGQTRPVKLQDAAYNFNMATRFGRMDVATELVSPKGLAKFAERHGAWGGAVRVVDVEFRGMQFSGKDDALVQVAVGWQRADDPNLLTTNVSQRWSYESNNWKLVDEQRASGDVGLLGETVELVRPGTRANAYFPSITIR